MPSFDPARIGACGYGYVAEAHHPRHAAPRPTA